MNCNVWEIVTAIATSVLAIQIIIMFIAEKKSHEETRRIKTIELMQNWSQSLQKETSFADKIVSGFSEEQCRKLYFKEDIIISKQLGNKVCQICPAIPNNSNNKNDKKFKRNGFINTKITGKDNRANSEYLLTGTQLLELRWLIITYLNMLETVMAAWENNIVDHAEIARQFQYLYDPEHGNKALEHFRIAAGGKKTYPHIENFILYLENEHNEFYKFKKKRRL